MMIKIDVSELKLFDMVARLLSLFSLSAFVGNSTTHDEISSKKSQHAATLMAS